MTNPRDPDATTTPDPILSEQELVEIAQRSEIRERREFLVPRDTSRLLASHRALTERLAKGERAIDRVRNYEMATVELAGEMDAGVIADLRAQLAAKDATIAELEQFRTSEARFRRLANYLVGYVPKELYFEEGQMSWFDALCAALGILNPERMDGHLEATKADLAAERTLRQAAEARAGEMRTALESAIADCGCENGLRWARDDDGVAFRVNCRQCQPYRALLATPTADHAAKGEADAS